MLCVLPSGEPSKEPAAQKKTLEQAGNPITSTPGLLCTKRNPRGESASSQRATERFDLTFARSVRALSVKKPEPLLRHGDLHGTESEAQNDEREGSRSRDEEAPHGDSVA